MKNLKNAFIRIAMLVAAVLCVTMLPAEVNAEAVAEGTCGENLTWALDDQGTLTIFGTGAMTDDYAADPLSWEQHSTTAPRYSRRSKIKSLIIEDGVASIGEYAFSGCTGLTSITIPDSVTSIGSSAFYNCSNLEGIWVDTENSAYTNDTYGILYSKDMTTLIQAPAKLAGNYVIPDGVTSIGDFAFYDCSSLKEITIGSSLHSIGDYVFSNCTGLETVYYSGTEEQSLGINFKEGNYFLWGADWVYDYQSTPDVEEPGQEDPTYIPGDVNGDNEVNDADAIHLLYYTFVPDLYPVNQPCDFNGDNEVTDQDAIYLLYYTFVPDLYPLN